jgi:hypothetical protein
MSDVQCPYCQYEFDVCHDDGHGMDESTRWEESCPECSKQFVFTTYFTVSHTGYKADCLNGGGHDLKLSRTYPKKFSKMECKDCDFERQPTKEECPEVYL